VISQKGLAKISMQVNFYISLKKEVKNFPTNLFPYIYTHKNVQLFPMETYLFSFRRIVTVVIFIIFITGCGNSLENKLKEAAIELNKSCPMMVDSETRFDSAMTVSSSEFQYNYTLVNLKPDDIDPEQLIEVLKPLLVNNIAINPDLNMFRDNDVTLTYLYKDMNGDFFAKIPVTPADYRK
jgi:hypothetical protein